MSKHSPLALPADRPALLLGIDGVINVHQCELARETIVAPHLPALLLLPGLPEWLAALDRSFTLIWCSAGAAPALQAAAQAWGLGPRPLLRPGQHLGSQPGWRALARFPGQVAWVDDGFSDEARAWAAERLRAGRPTWLADVHETGLTAELTDLLLQWVAP